LGAQLLAHVLGSPITKAPEMEIGWGTISMTKEAKEDPVFGHFRSEEKVFQIHCDTFQIPKSATHLAKSSVCSGQAFRYGKHAYGMQFHLEADEAMILRWINSQKNYQELFQYHQGFSAEKIIKETGSLLPNSTQLSQKSFRAFTEFFHESKKSITFKSR
jgi:GMP synthase (glutamine-hydrolysing)